MNISLLLVAIQALLPLQAEGSTRVAVVFLPEASEKYQRTTDLESQFDGVRKQFQQQRDAQKEKIERMAKSLQEELKPGTDEYRDRAKQIAMLDAELKFFVESETQRIEGGLKDSLRVIFDDIQAAVKKVAEARGIDVVIACDRMPDQPPESANQLRQQIMLQKVLYWNPRVDITADVIAQLHADYRPTPAAVPAGGSAAPVKLEDPKARPADTKPR